MWLSEANLVGMTLSDVPVLFFSDLAQRSEHDLISRKG